MTDHPFHGRGFSSVPHYTVECSKCGGLTIWATSARINAFWTKIRRFETVEALMAKLTCEKCGGRPNRIEFDYGPARMGVSSELPPVRKVAE